MPEVRINETSKVCAHIVSHLTGVPEDECKGCCGIITDDMTPKQLDIASLISLIMTIVMQVIQNCPKKAGFRDHIKFQTVFGRAWFRWFAVRPNGPYKFGDTTFTDKEVTRCCLDCAHHLPEASIDQCYDECKVPNWDMFE